LAHIDAVISNYRPDSAIEQLNATISDQPLTVDSTITALITEARAVSVASHGCYDITIKPLFDLWGFKGDKLTPPSAQALQSALQAVGFDKIDVLGAGQLRKLNPTLRIDLSSIGQGYSVGRLANILAQQGINDYLIEIGGELVIHGQKPDGEPWRVALEKPLSGERTLQKVMTIRQTESLAIMTSGTYRHYFDVQGKRYSHILNAHTGAPVSHQTVSVTVLHHDPTQADAWSTALLCLGRADGMAVAQHAGIAALFIEQQGDNFAEFRSESLQTHYPNVIP
jgi:thiamine biosynthesis lipoprotein